MPHFTLTVGPLGLVLDAWVGISTDRLQALERSKQPIPNSIQVRALVDTGASCTCVDPNVLKRLAVEPTGRTKVHTPSTAGQRPHETNQYDVAFMIPSGMSGESPLFVKTIPVVEAELEHQGYQALIGRDILGRCLLVYEGRARFFTLAF